jgi:2-oxoglutarate dehydrogenase E2 component (dihydrolipoamide succinyltransferase)
MSKMVNVALPKLGESIMNATVMQWFKKVGDPVQLDEALLEVSTDKVNSEIPSPVAGVVKSILASVDQEIAVGDILAIIEVGASTSSQAPSTPSPSKQATEKKGQEEDMQDFFSPGLLRMAREEGIAMDELQTIPTTGAGGRLTKKDLEEYVAGKARQRPVAAAPCPMGTIKGQGILQGVEVERVKMSGMRKAIADNMVRSFYEAPHATLITEVDVTAALKLVQKHKEEFLAKYNVKLTITSFVARAISAALKEFPLINSSLEQDTIVVKRFVNLGIAVSVDQGILVPVIKHCHRLSLHEIARELHDLSQKARNNSLTPHDVKEGTITLTNFGMSGVAIGIPIIRYPEVAIIGIGAIQKKVAVLEEDTIAIRSMMNVSLTFDHRVLDGMYGCGFLNALKKHLENDIVLN